MRIKTVIFLALVAGITADAPCANAQATCAEEVANIQAYTKKIDKLIKQEHSSASKRTFARHPMEARQRAGQWFAVGGNAETSNSGFAETASEWSVAGKIVAAQLVIQSLSENWVHRVLYYFRDDGTLARISSTLDSSLGARIVVREQFLDRKGLVLSKSSQRYTLRAKNKPGHEAVDQPVPVFMTPVDLPFYQARRD
jgi:hypothetical protein